MPLATRPFDLSWISNRGHPRREPSCRSIRPDAAGYRDDQEHVGWEALEPQRPASPEHCSGLAFRMGSRRLRLYPTKLTSAHYSRSCTSRPLMDRGCSDHPRGNRRAPRLVLLRQSPRPWFGSGTCYSQILRPSRLHRPTDDRGHRPCPFREPIRTCRGGVQRPRTCDRLPFQELAPTALSERRATCWRFATRLTGIFPRYDAGQRVSDLLRRTWIHIPSNPTTYN